MALTRISNQSLSAVTTLPSAIPTGALTLISTQTASSSASISFTSGIDSTYDSYVFKFIDIHPETDAADLTFQGSTDSGSTYATTITSSFFLANHSEADANFFQYYGDKDLAQSTSFQTIGRRIGADNDQQSSGTLQIFNPSSTTFVKHFIARLNSYIEIDYSEENYVAGYFNSTSAIDAVQFKMSSGNIDAGVIKLYGVS